MTKAQAKSPGPAPQVYGPAKISWIERERIGLDGRAYGLDPDAILAAMDIGIGKRVFYTFAHGTNAVNSLWGADPLPAPGMSPKEEAADLQNENPLPAEPDCKTCQHGVFEEIVCGLAERTECTYAPENALPILERIYWLDQRKKHLEAVLKETTKQQDDLIEEAVKTGTFESENFILKNKPRVVRLVNVEEFKKRFPDAFKTLHDADVDAAMKKLQTVMDNEPTVISPVKAEELVGKKPLAEVCTDQVYPHYSIVALEVS